MRADLLGFIMLGLIAAGATIGLIPLNRLFHTVKKPLFFEIVKRCRSAVVNKYPFVDDKANLNTSSSNNDSTAIRAGQLATGCLFKALLLDLEGRIPEGSNLQEKETFRFYKDCLSKYNKLTNGDFEAIGKYLDEGKWCGSVTDFQLVNISPYRVKQEGKKLIFGPTFYSY